MNYGNSNNPKKEDVKMEIKLIPAPQKISMLSGYADISKFSTKSALTTFVPAAQELFPFGGDKEITLTVSKSADKEEYRLLITENSVEITAAAPPGAYYALCTLKQMIDIYGNTIPCCDIQDKPDMKLRGASDDICNQMSTMENYKDIIFRLSLIKHNIYMPYIEDVLKFDCMPEFGKYSNGMEKEEWRELVEYAKRYYVKIIPIINCAAHWRRNCKQEAFSHLMLHEDDDPAKPTTENLDPRNSEARALVKAILDEVAEVFGEAGMIHVGGDEVEGYVPVLGKEEAIAHYNSFHKEMYGHLAAKGIQMMMYSDMYTPLGSHSLGYVVGIEQIEDMPEDICFVYWDYYCKDYYSNIKDLRDRGKTFIVSPTTATYGRFLPGYQASWNNTRLLSREGKGCGGLITSAWGGLMPREKDWFGFYIAALYSWNNQDKRSFDDAVKSFFELFYGINDLDVERFNTLINFDLGTAKDQPEYDENGNMNPLHYEHRSWFDMVLTKEFFKDATQPVNMETKAQFKDALPALESGLAYFIKLSPIKNKPAYQSFLLSIKCTIAAVKKVMLLTDSPYLFREQAMADIPAIEALILEIEDLLKEHRHLWFLTNRESGWGRFESGYIDLIDSFHALKRYCRHSYKFDNIKRLHL